MQIRRKILCISLAGILALGGAGVGYADKHSGKGIFLLEPTHIESGVPYYTPEQVDDLSGKIYPARITGKTNDGYFHWSNDPRYVGLLERIIGRFFPTHNLELSPVNGEYRFDIRPIR